jgi:nucleotide-binding universal stress UspA family protein
LKRALLGSVAEEVARRSARPVLIVRWLLPA